MRLLGSKICSWEFNEAMKVGVDVSVTKAEWFHGLGRDPNQARSTVSESWTRQQDLASHSNSSKVFKFLRGIPEKKPTPYWKHQLAFVTFFISFLPSNPPSSLDQKVAVILSRLSSRLKGPFSTQEASSVGGCLYFLRLGTSALCRPPTDLTEDSAVWVAMVLIYFLSVCGLSTNLCFHFRASVVFQHFSHCFLLSAVGAGFSLLSWVSRTDLKASNIELLKNFPPSA